MLVLVFIFSIYSASACVVPTNGMVITEDTTFCKGEYFLPGIDISAIIIGADNVVLDCNGASLIGSQDGRFGIYSYGHDHLTIKNCHIEDYRMGIFLSSGVNSLNYNKIKNNAIFGYGGGYGIKGMRFVDSEISINHISNFGDVGIDLDLSENNYIYGNSVYGPGKGLSLDHGSSANNIRGNILCTSDFGLDCVSSEYNFGEHNKFDLLNNGGGCSFIGYSSCNMEYSSSECGSLGGRCSSEVNPGEISIGTCEDNPPKKVIPQMQEAVGGPRFSGEMNLFDKIKYFFRGLFVKQSKLRIENVQSRSGGSDPNNCVITPLAVSDFNGTPGCLGSAVNYINLCDPNRNGVYSYDVDIESFLNYGTGISLGEGLFCSISDSSCSPVVNYNAVYPRNCNDSLNSWSIIGLEGNYSGGELNGLGVDSCISGTDVSLSCFELNEVYHKFGTDINEWRPNYDLDWALDWAGSEGVNSGNGHSWHESGYFEDKMMCGYCGDGVMGPHEYDRYEQNIAGHDCNDSSFSVSLGGDEKCVCLSDDLIIRPGDYTCDLGEYDSGHMNGCHGEVPDLNGVCGYEVCENGVCVVRAIPVQKPSCEGDEWYNNQPCNDPDSQCYGNSCLGGAYCDGNGECSGGNPVCCDECSTQTCYVVTCGDGNGCGLEPKSPGSFDDGCESDEVCDGEGNCDVMDTPRYICQAYEGGGCKSVYMVWEPKPSAYTLDQQDIGVYVYDQAEFNLHSPGSYGGCDDGNCTWAQALDTNAAKPECGRCFGCPWNHCTDPISNIWDNGANGAISNYFGHGKRYVWRDENGYINGCDHSCDYGECSGWSAGCSADPDGGYYTVYSNW